MSDDDGWEGGGEGEVDHEEPKGFVYFKSSNSSDKVCLFACLLYVAQKLMLVFYKNISGL